MEGSSSVGVRQVPCISYRRRSCYGRGRGRGRGWVEVEAEALSSGYYKDKGHVDYYNYKCNNNNKDSSSSSSSKKMKMKMKMKMKKEEEEKKKLKSLRKGLTKDLFTLTHIHPHKPLLSEAAHVLIKHLEQLRVDEEEQQQQQQQQHQQPDQPYMANYTAGNMMKPPPSLHSYSTTSSSSSESSDSECEDAMVLPISNSATKSTAIAVPPPMPPFTHPLSTSPPLPLQPHQPKPLDDIQKHGHQGFCTDDCTSSTITQSIGGTSSAKIIEVCMGGKCKKSGGAVLLEEFEKLMGGVQGAVVGCKCMGKCRDGPNVRLKSSTAATGLADSVRTPPNPICIGVGLDDVSLIVADFFGQQDGKDTGFAS